MMTVTEFTSLSKNYDALNEEQRLALEKITYRYPYFQAVYALYLKSLKEQEKFNFDLILKKTAVISPDRNTLYEWLYSELEVENSTAIAPQEKEKTKPVLETVVEAPKKSLPVNLSFLEWIEWTKNNSPKVLEDSEPQNSFEDKIDIIDAFLKNNPKIPPVSANTAKQNLSKEIKFDKEELMTETLAKVYVKQGKFKKALLSYKILSLKYPEKNSFFADQIKAIKDLQQK
ncbi:hypothetical protein N9605_04075 [Flavobacteriaceae bacterium]|nr:hypothetical protein [Flavobacteriaceae bacterium]